MVKLVPLEITGLFNQRWICVKHYRLSIVVLRTFPGNYTRAISIFRVFTTRRDDVTTVCHQSQKNFERQTSERTRGIPRAYGRGEFRFTRRGNTIRGRSVNWIKPTVPSNVRTYVRTSNRSNISHAASPQGSPGRSSTFRSVRRDISCGPPRRERFERVEWRFACGLVRSLFEIDPQLRRRRPLVLLYFSLRVAKRPTKSISFETMTFFDTMLGPGE